MYALGLDRLELLGSVALIYTPYEHSGPNMIHARTQPEVMSEKRKKGTKRKAAAQEN